MVPTVCKLKRLQHLTHAQDPPTRSDVRIEGIVVDLPGIKGS
jgi:hypothetical protein